MDDVLPADGGEIPEESRRKGRDPSWLIPNMVPGIRSEEQDYKEWIRRESEKKKKAFKGYKEKVLKPAEYTVGRYRFARAWLNRAHPKNRALLEEWIEGNVELTRLRKVLQVPWAERRNQMSKQIRNEQVKPLHKQREALQSKIEVVVRELVELDAKMRAILEKIDMACFKAHFCSPPTDRELKTRIKEKIKRLTFNMAHQFRQSEILKLQAMHGFHGYLRKKYKGSNIELQMAEAENAPPKKLRRMRRRFDRHIKEKKANEGEMNEHSTE